MTYAQARDAALKLLNRYSVAGTQIPSGYNNQQDALSRMPELLDDGQLYIATTCCPIPAVCALSTLDCVPVCNGRVYTLPPDFFRLEVAAAGILPTGWAMVGPGRLYLPDGAAGQTLQCYLRYPRPLGASPADDTPLDNCREAQMALPYYAAAHLALGDDAFAYASLYNEFEARMVRMRRPPRAIPGLVEEVYRFGDGEALS